MGKHAVAQLQARFAAIPFLVVIGGGWISGLDTSRTIAALLWTGGAMLVLLAAVAGP